MTLRLNQRKLLLKLAEYIKAVLVEQAQMKVQ
jgi:hypothetical protein